MQLIRHTLIFALTATALAQYPPPRAPKHGEERTPMLDAKGASCGNLALIDHLWYFYWDYDKGKPTRVHHFDTRAEAVKFAAVVCPKQGKAVIAK